MATVPEKDPSRTTLSTAGLLDRARDGDDRAVNTLFRRNGRWLRKWARGRLPQWARTIHDTADIVQDVLMQTLKRIDRFEDRGKGALKAYLRQAVDNRIRDVMRSVSRRPVESLDEEAALELPSRGPSPLDHAAAAERERNYKAALDALSEEERLLIVGRVELGYNYEQLALVSNRPTAEAARLAVRRAIVRLAERMATGSDD